MLDVTIDNKEYLLVNVYRQNDDNVQYIKI